MPLHDDPAGAPVRKGAVVFEDRGHQFVKLPGSRGYLVLPELAWFPKLRPAKAWLRGHYAAG